MAERPWRPSAAPATCSFTSCGCDHANGVTRQMRIVRSEPSAEHGPGSHSAAARGADCERGAQACRAVQRGLAPILDEQLSG